MLTGTRNCPAMILPIH